MQVSVFLLSLAGNESSLTSLVSTVQSDGRHKKNSKQYDISDKATDALYLSDTIKPVLPSAPRFVSSHPT